VIRRVEAEYQYQYKYKCASISVSAREKAKRWGGAIYTFCGWKLGPERMPTLASTPFVAYALVAISFDPYLEALVHVLQELRKNPWSSIQYGMCPNTGPLSKGT
jgi:hypothetical protein